MLLLCTAALTGCSADAEKPASSGAGGRAGRGRSGMAIPVTVATVERKDVPVQVRAIGSVEAYSTVGVKSQVTGELIGVHFQEGQDVHKGDLLFTIDPRPFEAQVRQQEATLAKDIAQAENQRATAKRYDELFKQGVISKEQHDLVETNAAALEATVRADRAALDAARLNLQYTKIYSPIDGRTGSLLVHQGNMVKANDTIDLVTINQIRPIFVSFTIPEQHLADVKRFMARGKLKVLASVPDAGKPLEGTVSFVDNAVDPATAMIRLKAVFNNAERRLWPGQFADVVLTLTVQPGAVVVPSQAVQTGQNGDYVFVVDSKRTAQERNVKVARTVGGDTVIAEGLQPGELVVTDGQLQLAPSGTRVQIKPGTEAGPVRPVPESRQSQRTPGRLGEVSGS